MEQVIRVYGRFLLEAVVFVMLLVLLSARMTDGQGNYGVFHLIGTHFDVSREETGRADFDSFAAESRVSSPVITYRYPGTLFTGTYETDILVGATDAAGESIDVRIRSVTNPYGETDLCGNESGGVEAVRQITFPQSGIYTLRVTATDAHNRRSVCEIRIPVNRREGTG